jgi:hypothetical protein
MAMPAYVYLVTVVDRSDFRRTVAERVCKTKRAADFWGSETRDERARLAYERGNDVVDFEYVTRAISYIDN